MRAKIKGYCILASKHHSSSIYTSYCGSKLYDYIRDNDLWAGPCNDDESHFSFVRYPYERKIRGILYKELKEDIIPRLTQHKGELLIYDK